MGRQRPGPEVLRRRLQYATKPLPLFMTPNPEAVTIADTLAFALHKMDIGGYRHLPVVSLTGEPVGIISARDILRHLTANL